MTYANLADLWIFLGLTSHPLEFYMSHQGIKGTWHILLINMFPQNDGQM